MATIIKSKPTRKYEVEVWWQGKTFIGEIGRLLNSFSWKEVRNGVDAIDFNIDQGILMDYCNKIGEQPSTLLQIKNTDIKIKRMRPKAATADLNQPPSQRCAIREECRKRSRLTRLHRPEPPLRLSDGW